mmetsp:Transcript_24997/g.44307  ORF Transcript_24997/g.44307 Transcript_24997/m.44307 type:complete len:208 (+) Transcript_24997:143-766(+)
MSLFTMSVAHNHGNIPEKSRLSNTIQGVSVAFRIRRVLLLEVLKEELVFSTSKRWETRIILPSNAIDKTAASIVLMQLPFKINMEHLLRLDPMEWSHFGTRTTSNVSRHSRRFDKRFPVQPLMRREIYLPMQVAMIGVKVQAFMHPGHPTKSLFITLQTMKSSPRLLEKSDLSAKVWFTLRAFVLGNKRGATKEFCHGTDSSSPTVY